MAIIDMDYALGSKVIEDVLWENPNPSSSFSQTTVTLSNGLSNYDAVRVYVKESPSSNVGADEYSETKLDFDSKTSSTGDIMFLSLAIKTPISTYNISVYRAFLYSLSNDTSITILNASGYDASGVNMNSGAIPVKITGVKY